MKTKKYGRAALFVAVVSAIVLMVLTMLGVLVNKYVIAATYFVLAAAILTGGVFAKSEKR